MYGMDYLWSTPCHRSSVLPLKSYGGATADCHLCMDFPFICFIILFYRNYSMMSETLVSGLSTVCWKREMSYLLDGSTV